jgi:hypothetical protein
MLLYVFRSTLLLITIGLFASCSREVDPALAGATLRFSVPSNSHSQKVGAQSVSTLFDQNKACFAIGLSGPGIPTNNSDTQCSRHTGRLSGMVRPANTGAGSQNTIEFQNISFGSNREVVVYAYDIPPGMGACPVLSADSFGSIPRDKIYIVGKSGKFAIDRAEVVVDISIALPTSDYPISSEWALPNDCPKYQALGAAPESPVGFRAVTQTGGPFVLHSQTKSIATKKLTGGSFKIHLKGR